MKKSKVFIGPFDTANNSSTFAEALNTIGIKADYISWRNLKHPFDYEKQKLMFQFNAGSFTNIFNKNTTAIINTILKYLYFFKILLIYNTFIFTSPRSILSDNRDLPILKIFKRKIIFIFCGCTERDINFQPHNPEFICNRCNDNEKKEFSLCNNLNAKRNRVQFLEKYSDFIVSQDDLSSYLKEKKQIWGFVIVKSPEKKDYLKKFEESKIKIAHFPSNPLIKLSHLIIPMMKRIAKERNNIEIVIKYNIPHKEVLSELSTTHILIDALGLGYGALGIEGMSKGCILLISEFDWFNKSVPDLPIIPITANNLYEKINYLIDNPSMMKDYTRRSIDFFYKYHSYEAAGKYYKENLELT